MKKFISASCALLISMSSFAQDIKVTINANDGKDIIPKEIYGQFAEHLGTCIYGGLWVGPESNIPNINGYRKDVFEALKALKVPVLRWPGGCFADDYHWMDGIGPKKDRPSLRNNNWGGTIEDNSFGTHEFLNLCEMLECEPYISGNVGSGTVKEMAQWIEYMTSDGDTPMARLRRANGRDKAWHVKFFGIGNEAWGCGGNMTPEYYSDQFRKFNTYLRDYTGNKLYRIASGASDYDFNWTKVLMNNIGDRANAVSLHFYTVKDWNKKGSATSFTDEEYYLTLEKCLDVDSVIIKHKAIMDEADPNNKIALMVDEWGTWWDEEPGTIAGHLYQQNCMRDAMVASLMLNVFHKHTDRVKMANIAQVVNVLQSMILTNDKGQMVLTPTYHVFQMYSDFQEATYLPSTATISNLNGIGNIKVPEVSVSAAKKADGTVVIAIANTSLKNSENLSIDINGINAKTVKGKVLTGKKAGDYNDFEHPNVVTPAEFKGAKLKKNNVSVKVPACSVTLLTVK